MRTLTEICRDPFHAERQVAGTSAIDIFFSILIAAQSQDEGISSTGTYFVNARTGQFSEHGADF